MTHPQDIKDLTRWNRGGLERFRYIDGNAVTYLETMRKNLAEAFPEWKKMSEAGEFQESDSIRLKRMIDQYKAGRQDWGWEIARTLSRSIHILTEHMNAFSNEGYLGTATQWEYMRRIVSMLDYKPTPPSSASTKIAIIADPEADPGLVKKGLQGKFASAETGVSLVYETLSDIEIDPKLNGLRVKNFDFNPHDFNPYQPLPLTGTAGEESYLWQAPEKAKINVGQLAVLVQGETARTVCINEFEAPYLSLKAPLGVGHLNPCKMGEARLLLEPDQVYTPALNGENTARVSDSSLFFPGQVVAWVKGTQTGFTQIDRVDENRIRFGQIEPAGVDLSGTDVTLFPAKVITKEQRDIHGAWLIGDVEQLQRNIHVIQANRDQSFKQGTNERTATQSHKIDDNYYAKLSDYNTEFVHIFDPLQGLPLGSVLQASVSHEFRIDGGIGKTRTGDWFVAEDRDGKLSAVQISNIEEKDDHFLLKLKSMPTGLSNIEFLHGPFNYDIRPIGHDRDPTEASVQGPVELNIPTDLLPDIFVPGKDVIFESEHEDGPPAFSGKIVLVERVNSINGQALPHPKITFDLPTAAHDNFQRGEVIVRANVVDFGHGETQPVYILGSGDASKIRQEFILERSDTAFISDARLESGVRSDFKLKVEDQIFEEVSRLSDSENVDPHYETEMTEDGFVKIIFGDGRNGRRLQTGRNNVTVIYRKGTGGIGNNVPPYSFAKPSKPHKRVKKLIQPLSSSGGQQIEDVTLIRQNAPDHLKSLSRGVSVTDFEHIARNTPGIWHAKAYETHGYDFRKNTVGMCVVPANDAPLGQLETDLYSRLSNLSSPNMDFVIRRFIPVRFLPDITVRINSQQFDPDLVKKRVREAVWNAFKLENRKPGEPIYSSTLYKIVETVPGVANSDVRLKFELAKKPDLLIDEDKYLYEGVRKESKNGADVWVIWPYDLQVVYLSSPGVIGIEDKEALI